MRFIFYLLLTLSFFKSSNAFGAACCSGGSSLPTILLNDDRWTLRATTSSSFVVGDVEGNGKSTWRSDALAERSLNLTASTVYRWNDFFQSSLKIMGSQKTLDRQSRWAMGDTTIASGWEPFPLYTYSWRPRFLLVSGISIPTGKSVYDSEDAGLQSSGSGFWTPSIGLVATKQGLRWDWILSMDAKFQLEGSYQFEDVDPGNIYSAKAGLGYSLGDWRLGMMAGPAYEEGRRLKRAQTKAAPKLVWDSQVDLSKLISDRWSMSLAYADQTLAGPAYNASLERSLSLTVIYHGL